MKLLDEIRQQPKHIRMIFMWLIVVVTFSVFGFWYLGTLGENVTTALNTTGEPAKSQAKSDTSTSPFSAMGKSFSNLGASISKLIKGKDSTQSAPPQASQSLIPVQKLPVK